MCWEKNNIVIVFNIHGITRFNTLHIILLYDDYKCVSTKRESVSENFQKEYMMFKCPLPNNQLDQLARYGSFWAIQNTGKPFDWISIESSWNADEKKKKSNRHGVTIILIWHDITKEIRQHVYKTHNPEYKKNCIVIKFLIRIIRNLQNCVYS